MRCKMSGSWGWASSPRCPGRTARPRHSSPRPRPPRRTARPPPLASPPSTATAMVSTGNYDEKIQLPAVERAYGAERFALLDVEASAAMEVPAAVIVAALSPLGWGKLTAAGADMV